MYVTKIPDNITSSNYKNNDNMTLSNCTNNESNIDVILPTFLLTIPGGLSFFFLL